MTDNRGSIWLRLPGRISLAVMAILLLAAALNLRNEFRDTDDVTQEQLESSYVDVIVEDIPGVNSNLEYFLRTADTGTIAYRLFDDYFRQHYHDTEAVAVFPEYRGTKKEPAPFWMFNTLGPMMTSGAGIAVDGFYLNDRPLTGTMLYYVPWLKIIDGDYTFALHDPAGQRYWIVAGSGWSAERFLGPYRWPERE